MIVIGIILGIVCLAFICCVICTKNSESRQLKGAKNREVNEMRKLKSQVEKKTTSGESVIFKLMLLSLDLIGRKLSRANFPNNSYFL